MRIFLSVAGPDRARVEDVAFTLRGEGHQVFLDEHSLPPGGVFHRRIREAIAQADLVVFFISLASLEADRYTLTELKFIEDRFPHPQGRVLPTILYPHEFANPATRNKIPSYLRAVTFCTPKGDLAAEVAYDVSKMADALERQGAKRSATSTREIPGFANTTSGSVQAKAVEAAIAGVGLAAVAIVLSFLAHEFDNKLDAMGMMNRTNPVSAIGHGLAVTLPIWLAALLFNVRGLAAYLALATGAIAAFVFAQHAIAELNGQPVVLYIGKSCIFAACAAVAIPGFRTLQSVALILVFGAFAGQLVDMYGRDVSGFIWEALITSIATFIMAWNEVQRYRVNRIQPS